ncbi:thiamine diphosphokinase [Planomicrobium sp. YIM 101495]|uniref:thiamine diphosphokinase n=1 Tax=Planomicrobium sp. YIM 101495 TaxID=2665160 RepID=UPI0013FC8BBF|nr:thiamine diphosphokinase [Planomicrobium sp. YIM 101495]
MKIVITAGGPAAELPDFSLWEDVSYVGVDAGCMTLLEKGVHPVAVVGDFDSVSDAEYEHLRGMFPDLEKVSAEKDETDTELALQKAVELGGNHITVIGVTGGRLDHYMSALHAVYNYQERYSDVAFEIVNYRNRLRFLSIGEHQVGSDPAYKYISFYPFSEAIEGFHLKGFKYEVVDETIPFGSTRFVSNELDGEGMVVIGRGNCLMIESSDI